MSAQLLCSACLAWLVIATSNAAPSSPHQQERSVATDPLMNDATRIEPILRRSPALVEYLRCDAPLDHAGDVAAIANVCALVLGK